MPEHYKFIGEDGIDSDVPLGRIVRFENGLNTEADSSVGVWRDATTGMLKGQKFEHSSLIPFRQKFRVLNQVKFADQRTEAVVWVSHVYCNLASGQWIYTIGTGTEHPESELVGVPKPTAEHPNVVEKRDSHDKMRAYATAYGGAFSTEYASSMAAYRAMNSYWNWGPIGNPFRALEAGQTIREGDMVTTGAAGATTIEPPRWAVQRNLIQDIEMTFDAQGTAYQTLLRSMRNP